MKHLKLFENNNNWSDQKLRQHIEDEEFIMEILKKYIIWKEEIPQEETRYHIKYIEAYFFDTKKWYSKNNNFVIQYEDPDGERHEFVVEDYNEMIGFLDNPKMFTDANKYNV